MSFRKILIWVIIVLIGVGVFLFLGHTKIINVALLSDVAEIASNANPVNSQIPIDPNKDLGPQPPLLNPPATIKAIYATNWSAGSEKKLSYLINLIDSTELNAIVIDIKDFTGLVGYETDLELVKKYGAFEKRIPKINSLIKRLHDKGIYIIGRIAVFQDQQLIKARPDLALKNKNTGAVWRDHKGLGWVDPASQEAWDYNIAIAKDILARGFDEVNFDYIRFASDGNLNLIRYPVWSGENAKQSVMESFFQYLRLNLPDARMSADLFGMVTTNYDDLGIGQYLESALPYFDAIAPMVYPSHYPKGFLNYQNPAAAPYPIVKYSLDSAVTRMKNYELGLQASTTENIRIAKLRPWLQDFDLGAVYDAVRVGAEIQAVVEAASNSPDLFDGWMLWSAENIYTKDALKLE